ncbi:MAG: hypothetical protein HZC47_04400 [Methanobacterium sp.]|uniref:hypothetical protein n=1 Tax=Methanobacterium sp. TaxID=2164 RepID=UPI003D65F04A|nr:hypothetical protein [Methanobacterium sp.]
MKESVKKPFIIFVILGILIFFVFILGFNGPKSYNGTDQGIYFEYPQGWEQASVENVTLLPNENYNFLSDENKLKSGGQLVLLKGPNNAEFYVIKENRSYSDVYNAKSQWEKDLDINNSAGAIDNPYRTKDWIRGIKSASSSPWGPNNGVMNGINMTGFSYIPAGEKNPTFLIVFVEKAPGEYYRLVGKVGQGDSKKTMNTFENIITSFRFQ